MIKRESIEKTGCSPTTSGIRVKLRVFATRGAAVPCTYAAYFDLILLKFTNTSHISWW